jgi:hypothetical protein
LEKKKVIYSEFTTEESKYIIECLQEDHNWEPCFIHGNKGLYDWATKKYNCKGALSEELRKGFFNFEDFDNTHPIDSEFINKLSKFELRYLNWLEDCSGWEFSYLERRNYYYNILKYWNTVINELKPDVFITYNWPHLPSDYALYLVCKYIFNIPVLFVDVVPRNNSNYFNIGVSLDDLETPFMDFYRSEESKEISPVVSEYLEKLRSEEPKRPWYIDRYFENYQKKMRKQLWKTRARMTLSTLAGRSFKPSNSAYKKNRKALGTKKPNMSILEHFIFREKLRSKNLKLKGIYQSMISQPKEGEKYLFFAAPYQPEAFSNLINDVYEDVFLILDLLCAHLPSDWKIYYKEHPATFNEMDKGALGRSQEFYKKLKTYKQVKCVSTSISSFELLDNSQGTVTTGGTIGWESVVRGKPTIVFGSMWYVGCDSVFNVLKNDDVKEAITKISEGFLPSKDDVNRYAQAISLASIKDLPAPYYYKDILDYDKDIKGQMKAVSDAYVDAYNKFYN